MSIDWLTVIAQIVNFLVLVFILKRFLYGPVLAAMARRQARIANRLDEARQREATAQMAREALDSELAELDQNRHALLAQARDDVDRVRGEMLDEARHEVEASRGDWCRDLERERETARVRLRELVAECGIETARTLLDELAGIRLDARMVERFLERLADFDVSELRAACVSSGVVHIRSAGELDATDRSRITRTLHALVAKDLRVEYEAEASLLAGIELNAGGLRIGWTLSAQLESVERRLHGSLHPREYTEAGAAPVLEIAGD